MLGSYDFCGHYEWTFAWLEREGGQPLLHQFWAEAIGGDSQRHLADLIAREGFEGMRRYWAHTLEEESPLREFTITSTAGVFRIDMHDCPSKGFLRRNGLAQHRDYCDHCIGWIGPVLDAHGYVIDHEHNHCGKCWWEMRRRSDASQPSQVGELAGENDVRSQSGWATRAAPLDRFCRANDATAKERGEAQ